MSKPTRKDAEIIIQLAGLATHMGTGDGSAIIWSDDFDGSPDKHPTGTEEYGKILDLMRWMETIGTLHRNGVLNEDLLFDWIAIYPAWDRVKKIAESQRKNLPALWENFEYMAERQRHWKPRRDRKAATVAHTPATAKAPSAKKVTAGNGTS